MKITIFQTNFFSSSRFPRILQQLIELSSIAESEREWGRFERLIDIP